jgi:hypothetical protein
MMKFDPDKPPTFHTEIGTRYSVVSYMKRRWIVIKEEKVKGATSFLRDQNGKRDGSPHKFSSQLDGVIIYRKLPGTETSVGAPRTGVIRTHKLMPDKRRTK